MEQLKLNPRVPVPPMTLLDPETVRQIVEEKHALVFTFVDFNRPTRQVDIFLRPDLVLQHTVAGDAEFIHFENFGPAGSDQSQIAEN